MDLTQNDTHQTDLHITHLLKSGLHSVTNAKFIALGIPAVLIGQTVGDAPLSAGFHAPDGEENGHQYCAAVDLRIAHYNLQGDNTPMTTQEIYALVSLGSLRGLCMFFRHPGFDGTPIDWPKHIHLVDAGVRMKPELSAQVHDFRLGFNGLASHGRYSFFHCSQYAGAIIHAAYLQANP